MTNVIICTFFPPLLLPIPHSSFAVSFPPPPPSPSLLSSQQVGAHKWTWWFVTLVFAILITIQLAKMCMAENVAEITKMLTYIVIFGTCLFPLMWLLGSEGTAALGLSQEVGIVAVGDLVCSVGFGLYFLLNYDQVMEDEESDTQQYV